MKPWLRKCIGLLAAVLLVLLDRVTKTWAVGALRGKDAIGIIPGALELTYVENRGMAFGLFQNRRWVFLVITVVVLAVVLYLYLRMSTARRYLLMRVSLLLLAAGAVGNFIDRLIQSYVIDFIYFSLIDFPVFNVADIYVTVSGFLIAFLVLFIFRDADFSVMLGRSRKNG